MAELLFYMSNLELFLIRLNIFLYDSFKMANEQAKQQQNNLNLLSMKLQMLLVILSKQANEQTNGEQAFQYSILKFLLNVRFE